MNVKSIHLNNSEKIGLISNLSTMLSAGIAILEVIESLLEDAKGNTKKILEVLRDDLTQGKHVHQTFAKFPGVFDKVTVSVLKAAEEAGTLDVTLKDLKLNIQKEIEFMDKVKFAMLYPVFIILVFLGVLVMMLFVVIPKIASVFSRLKVDLPLPTKILIFMSNLLVNYTWFIVGGIIIGAILLVLLYKKKRNFILGLFFSLPLISGLVKEIDLTRFSRSLYLLLYSGLPITAALELTADVVIRRETARIITKSKELVMTGKNLSEGFRTSKGYIPTIMIKLIEAGEKTGTLDKSMQDISEFFDYQVSNTLKTLTALLEPVMLVVVGLVVGGMMIAIIAPIYGLIGKVGAR